MDDHGVACVDQEASAEAVEDHGAVEDVERAAKRNCDDREAHHQCAEYEHHLIVHIDESKAASGRSDHVAERSNGQDVGDLVDGFEGETAG